MKPTLHTRLITVLQTSQFLFLFFGAINTALTFLLYSGLILLHVHYIAANTIAWIVGILVSFTFNAKFTFKKEFTFSRFKQFLLVNVFSYFLSTGLLALMVQMIGLHPIAASVIAIPIVVANNYFFSRYVVFK